VQSNGFGFYTGEKTLIKDPKRNEELVRRRIRKMLKTVDVRGEVIKWGITSPLTLHHADSRFLFFPLWN